LEPGYLSQCSVWLRAGRSGFDPRQRQRISPLASASRPALGPTQPPVQWVSVALSPGVKRGREVTLTTYPPSSAEVKNEQELYLLSPHAPAWRVAGSLYFYKLWRCAADFSSRLLPPLCRVKVFSLATCSRTHAVYIIPFNMTHQVPHTCKTNTSSVYFNVHVLGSIWA
jgi:hypothetical protein